MGKYNGRPLRDIIEGLRSDDNENIEGFNVVICGPLAAGFPLGAVTWKELAISKYLCDYVEIVTLHLLLWSAPMQRLQPKRKVDPASALHAAQRWLRDSPASGDRAFMRKNPGM